MNRPATILAAALAALSVWSAPRVACAQDAVKPDATFQPLDVFQLEWAADPEISPDGRQIVFVRQGYDVMKDNTRSALWIVNSDGTGLRALDGDGKSYSSPRWSPDGSRLLFVSNRSGSNQLWMRWMDSGQEAELTHLADQSPGRITWSPDGKSVALTLFVP
ncbi:MAG: TolB family protein, partial [Gemmatimonadaceae bacterium]